METRTSPMGFGFTVYSASELRTLDGATADSLGQIPPDVAVGIIRLAKDAPYHQLADMFDNVAITRNRPYGIWFDRPPHVVVAWTVCAQIELQTQGSPCLLVNTQPADQQPQAYSVRRGEEDLVIIPTAGPRNSLFTSGIQKIMAAQAPSTTLVLNLGRA